MYGYGPGPYLFGGPEGLEAALIAAENGENWLELFKKDESSAPDEATQ